MATRKIQSPEEVIAEFLTEAPKDVLTGRGGAPCQTCRHPQRKNIEEACRLFNEKRRTGQTSASWSSFLRHALKPKFGYGLDVRSLRRHLENCLEWEIV